MKKILIASLLSFALVVPGTAALAGGYGHGGHGGYGGYGYKGYGYGGGHGYKRHHGYKHNYGHRRHYGYGNRRRGYRHHGYRHYYGPSYFYSYSYYGHRPYYGYSYAYPDSYRQPRVIYVEPDIQYNQSNSVLAPPPADQYQPSPPPAQVSEGCRMVREYQTQITVGGRLVDAYGDNCLKADGSWERGQPKFVPE